MSLTVVQGDITQLAADVIVNAANSNLRGGGGVDGAIHRAAGPSVMDELDLTRAFICPLKDGDFFVTTAGKLRAHSILHTVGPIWRGGQDGEPEALAQCYRGALLWMRENGMKSIAFPSISTGVYRYPKRQAAEIAIRECDAFPDLDVTFVVFDDETFSIYNALLFGDVA